MDERVALSIGINKVLYDSLEVLAKLHNTTVEEIIASALFDYVEKSARSLDFIQNMIKR